MRILVAHSFYRVPGGEDRYVRQLVELLQPDHQIDLLARFNDSLPSAVPTAIRMTFSRAELQAVEERIRMFSPHVIHVHNTYPAMGPAIHLAARRLRVPVVQTVHNLRLRCPNGLMFTEGRLCRRCEAGNYANAVLHACFPSRAQAGGYAGGLWVHRFILRLERMVAAFIAPSDFLRQRLVGWGIPGDRIRTVRNFAPPTPGGSSTVGQYGTYVGRLSHEKGLPVLLEALSLAGDPPFRIVGDGPLRSQLSKQADRLGLTRTTFTGRLEPIDVSRMMSESRFLVMPSLCDENAPLAVLEAMAAGRPVLVTRRGGLPELAATGAGLVCEPGDRHSMAGEIRRLITDEALCHRLGEQALNYARAELAAERHRARLDAIYHDVAVQARG